MPAWLVRVGILVVVATVLVLAYADEEADAQKPPLAERHLGPARHALVIGIGDYEDESIPDLDDCEADARRMHALLTDPEVGGMGGSQAVLLLGAEATLQAVLRRLAVLRKLPADSMVFLYFSGQGAKAGDELFWVVQDSKQNDLGSTAISETFLRTTLEQLRSERVVVVSDCGHAAGPASDTEALTECSPVLSEFEGKGRVILSAAGVKGRAPEDPQSTGSAFAQTLREGLVGQADTNGDGVVSLPELGAYLETHLLGRVRHDAGPQRTHIDFEGVREPSHFWLTVNAEVLRRPGGEKRLSTWQREARIQTLTQLSEEGLITPPEQVLGVLLLEEAPETLSDLDRERRRVYERLADGNLDPRRLAGALHGHRVLAPASTSLGPQRLETLRRLVERGLLPEDRAAEARKLYDQPYEDLEPRERRQRIVFDRLVDGSLEPGKLEEALASLRLGNRAPDPCFRLSLGVVLRAPEEVVEGEPFVAVVQVTNTGDMPLSDVTAAMRGRHGVESVEADEALRILDLAIGAGSQSGASRTFTSYGTGSRRVDASAREGRGWAAAGGFCNVLVREADARQGPTPIREAASNGHRLSMDLICHTSESVAFVGDVVEASATVVNTGDMPLTNVTLAMRGRGGLRSVRHKEPHAILIPQLPARRQPGATRTFTSARPGEHRVDASAREERGWAAAGGFCSVLVRPKPAPEKK